MRLARKIGLNALILLLAIGFLGLLYGLQSQQQLRLHERETFVMEARQGIQELLSVTVEYLQDNNDRARRQWLSRHQSLSPLLDTLVQEPLPGFSPILPLQEAHARQRRIFDSLCADQPPVHPPSATAGARAIRRLLAGQLIADIQRSVFMMDRVHQALDQREHQVFQESLVLSGITFVTVSLLLLVNLRVIRKRILAPVADLVSATRRIGSGDLEARIGSETPDEIGELARAIDRMALDLRQITVSRDEFSREVEERRRTERHLQHLLERYGLLMEGAGAGIWDWDIRQARIEFSAEWKAMRGYADDEVGNRVDDWTSGIHPDDRDRVMVAIREHFDGRSRIFEEPYRVLRKDGTWIWIQGRGQALRDAAGQVVRMAGTEIDITERRRAEQALRDNEERLRLAYQATNDVIWDWDIVADQQLWNQAGTQVFGWSDIVARPQTADWWVQRIHPEDRQRVEAGFFAVVNDLERQRWQEEYRFRKADGTYAEVIDRGRVVRDGEGRPVRMIGAMLDITERKRAEQEMRESEARYRTLMEHSGVHVLLLDRDGRYLMMNHKAAAAFGGRPEAFIGLSIFDLLTPEDAEEHLRANRQVIDSGVGRQYQRDFLLPGGRRTFLVIDQPVPDGEGRYVALQSSSIDITERVTMERALRLAQEDLCESQRLAHLGSWRLDLASHQVTWTPELYRMYGLDKTLPPPPYTEHHKLFTPESWTRLSTALAQTRETGTPYELELETTRRDGSHGWMWVRGEALFDDAGTIVGLRGAAQDISERKAADLRLRDSEHRLSEAEGRLRQILDTVGEGIYGVDKKGRCVFINPAAIAMLGYRDTSDLLGQEIHDRIHPTDAAGRPLPRERCPVHRTMERGETSQEDEVFTRADGHRFPVWIQAQALWREQEIIGAVVSFMDITARKEMEAALLREKGRAQDYLDVAGVMIVAIDSAQRVTMINRRGVEILGCDESEILGRNWFDDFLPESVREPVKRVFDQLIRGEIEPVEYYENPVITDRGEERLIAWHNSVLRDETEGILGILGSGEDITERRRAELALQQAKDELEQRVMARTAELKSANRELELAKEEAEAANRAKSLFLANMSHELRTPLNAILGFSQLMARERKTSPEQRESLGIINRAGEHLLAMINDVLDLSKIEAGKVELNLESCDLARLFQEVSEWFRVRAESKGLFLELTLAEDLTGFVKTDPGKLRQILTNLLGNAIKFTDAGGIRLRARRLPASGDEPWRLEVEVEDTGKGIPEARLKDIFDPFVQAEQDTGTQKGTGLGLAISRRFVEILGGEIRVESRVGQGSCFRFDLTVTQAKAIQEEPAERFQEVCGLAPDQPAWRVLVVDDDAHNRQLLSRTLKDVGLAVQTASNGEEAIALFRHWQPHFIWMDIQMPGLDGYAAVTAIRGLPGGRRVKIVAVTANVFLGPRDQDRNGTRLAEEFSECATLDRIFESGCDDVLGKPFRISEVFSLMTRHLGVRYRYAASPPPSGGPPATADLLRPLPRELVCALRDMALRLDIDGTEQVLEKIRALDPVAASSLEILASRFQYDRVGALCDEVLAA